MSHEKGGNQHGHGKLVAELGAAGLGLAAVGAVSFVAYRKRRAEAQRTLDPIYRHEYEKNLAIFNEPRMQPEMRDLTSAVAIRIFYATKGGVEHAITRTELQEELQSSQDEQLHVSRTKLERAIGYLKDHDLIDRQPKLSDPKVQGYYPAPSLEWGMEWGDMPEPLAQAQADFLSEQF